MELSTIEALRRLRADQPPTFEVLRALRRLQFALPPPGDLEHAAKLCLWEAADADDVFRRHNGLERLARVLNGEVDA